MKRHTLLGALALSLSLTVSASADTVTLAAYAGLFKERYVKAVIEPFMKNHPDIKVEFFAMANSAQMLGTLRAQKAAPQVDIAILDVSVAKVGKDEGIFAEIDETVSAHIADLSPLARPDGIGGVGLTFDSLVMLHNADAVSSGTASWEDLWDEKYDDKIIVPAAPDIQAIALTVIANRLAGGDDYIKSLEAGYSKLETLAPRVQTWEPKPDIYTAVASGQALIGIGWNARARAFAATLEKLKVAIPKEGSSFQINTIELVNGGPAPDSAKIFIDYALSPEAQAAFADAMYYGPTNTKAVVKPETAALMASTDPEKTIPINWLEIAKIRDAVTEAWRRRIIPLSR